MFCLLSLVKKFQVIEYLEKLADNPPVEYKPKDVPSIATVDEPRYKVASFFRAILITCLNLHD